MAKNIIRFPFRTPWVRPKSAVSRIITPRRKRDDKHPHLFHMWTSPETRAKYFFFLHSTDIIIRTKACSLSRHLTMVEPPMERHDWLKCSKSDIRHKALCKRAQNCWATTSNVVGCYMLRPFARPVACCCGLLGVYALSSFSLGTTEISRRNLKKCYAKFWGAKKMY